MSSTPRQRSSKRRLIAKSPAPALPRDFFAAVHRQKRRLTRDVLFVTIGDQRMWHFRTTDGSEIPSIRTLLESEGTAKGSGNGGGFRLVKQFIISTSRFGIGQVEGSNCTPLGLHRVARKIGGSQPIGTVFKGRKPIGTIATIGIDKAMICHRILWLDGLEPGFNRGGKVDTFKRYIYIHGFGDEDTLGRPQSHGCIHVGAQELAALFDAVPRGTLVWIQR
jgi:hypothetical protein